MREASAMLHKSRSDLCDRTATLEEVTNSRFGNGVETVDAGKSGLDCVTGAYIMLSVCFQALLLSALTDCWIGYQNSFCSISALYHISILPHAGRTIHAVAQ